MPALVFGLSSTGPITFGGTASVQRATPHRPPKMSDKDEARGTPEHRAEAEGEVETPIELVAVAAVTSPLPSEIEPPPVAEPAQPDDAQEDHDEVLPAEESGSAAGSESGSSHSIELTIDSLPHRELTQAIPVTVNPLGERLFTATVEALRLSGTGDTLTDALLTVKEQIEQMYDKLSKSTGLDEIEEDHLWYLRSHIKSNEESPKPKRGLWR